MEIWKTTVNIYKEKKFSFEEDKFEQKQVEVLAENDEYVCLNDRHFTTLRKAGDTVAYSVVGKESIRIEDGSGYFGRAMTKGIFYTLYSYSKKRPSTIRKEIEEALEKKYGWMVDADLSIIK